MNRKNLRRFPLEMSQIALAIFFGWYRAKSYGSMGLREHTEIIQVILNRIDSKKAHRVIDNVDIDAFVVEMKVNQIKGGVLRKYLLKSKNRKLPIYLHPNQWEKPIL